MTVNAGGDAQQVVVGEVADDNLGLCGELADGAQIVLRMPRSSFLDQSRQGPSLVLEPSLEVAATDKEQLGIDADGPEGTAVRFGDGSGAGPLVCKNHQAHSHALKVISFSNCRRHTSDV